MSTADQEIVLFVLQKDHRINPDDIVAAEDIPKMEQAVKHVVGNTANKLENNESTLKDAYTDWASKKRIQHTTC